MSTNSQLKPIVLYDHLPGILAGYPAVLFAILAVLSWIPRTVIDDEMYQKLEDVRIEAVQQMEPDSFTAEQFQKVANKESDYQWINRTVPLINSHMLFWVGLSVMVIWYVAFRFNMPKSKFLLMFFMFIALVGIPVVLELTTNFRPFTWSSQMLGALKPTVNTGAWVVMSLVFFVIWIGNFIYSRTHMRVQIDESGLTVYRLGGKGERFELIGLKTENEPLDYLEMFLAGVGSLSLKTRMNKPIFSMKRVIGLYWNPWLPFSKGKLARIEEILSYQGKVVSVDRNEQTDAAEMADMASDGDSDGHDMDDVLDEGDHSETDGGEFDAGGDIESSSLDERGLD